MGGVQTGELKKGFYVNVKGKRLCSADGSRGLSSPQVRKESLFAPEAGTRTTVHRAFCSGRLRFHCP